MHVRQSIRDNMVTALTGLTTTGANVFDTRFYPIGEDKLPALCVYLQDDDPEYLTIEKPRSVLHTAQFNVEAYVKSNSDPASTIDDIWVEVGEALETDITRGGYARDTQCLDVVVDQDADGDQPVMVAVIPVTVEYMVAETDAETAL